MLNLSNGSSAETVARSTEIVIEGFPRCANSFAVAAFRLAQHGDVEIAHHLHAPAQLLAGIRWRIPALCLIRKPDAAAASLAVRNPDMTLQQILREYTRFYSRIIPIRHRLVVGDWGQVTTNFGAVIHRINERFGTAFALFEHTQENVSQCFSPASAERRRQTQENLDKLHGSGLRKPLANANATYAAMIETNATRASSS